MHNIARSLVTIGAAAAFLGAGTFAAFTSVTTNAGNAFATGILSLTTNTVSAIFNVPNMLPGQNQTANLTVTNNGTLNLTYNVTANNTSGSDTLFNVLTLNLTKDGTGVYSGLLSNLNHLNLGTLNPSGSNDIMFNVELPLGTGDSVQNTTANVTFNFNATQ